MDADGTTRTFRAGEIALFVRGGTVSWESREHVKKAYACSGPRELRAEVSRAPDAGAVLRRRYREVEAAGGFAPSGKQSRSRAIVTFPVNARRIDATCASGSASERRIQCDSTRCRTRAS